MLSSSRQVGMGVGAIPLTEIHAYMKIHKINDLPYRKILLKRVQILDRAYLDYQNDVRIKEDKKRARKRAAAPAPRKKR